LNYLGIDIGTSGCKAVVFSHDGRELATANREYNVLFPDKNSAELDSDEVIHKCFDVIRECAAQLEPESVKALAISSQGEAFTPIGVKNEKLGNAMVSSDLRSQTYLNHFLKIFGEEKLYQITGHTAHPTFTLFKLMWLRENRPEIWKKVKYFLCFEDLLQFKLGVKPAISWSLAGRTMMFDVIKHQWHSEILQELGISLGQLATPIPSGNIIGKIDSSIAKDLGLPVDTQIVSGGHDQPCAALGSGVIEEGTAMYATGTVECISPVFNRPVFTTELRKSNLCTYDYTLPGKYTTVAYSLTGGNILKWFRDEFGQQEVAEAKQSGLNAYELLLKNIGTKPSELLVLPYFTPSGTPYFDTSTKGAILGLRLSTQRTDVIRALLEGVAYEMRLNLEILEKSRCKINELRAVGGGSKSVYWTQLKADVTDKKITILNITEAGCCGAAMLACSADSGKAINKLVPQWIKPLRTIYPQVEYKNMYREKFLNYNKAYQTIKDLKI
jgi:xylulokinase